MEKSALPKFPLRHPDEKSGSTSSPTSVVWFYLNSANSLVLVVSVDVNVPRTYLQSDDRLGHKQKPSPSKTERAHQNDIGKSTHLLQIIFSDPVNLHLDREVVRIYLTDPIATQLHIHQDIIGDEERILMK